MAPTRYRFYYPQQVRFADTDAQGHVFFGTYFTYLDEGLMAYLRNLGFPVKALLEMGIDMFYVDAHCQFKASATFEEMLHVHARIGRIGNSSLTAEFRIDKAENGEPLATGELVAVIIDVETRKPVRIPDRLRAAITDYESTG
jgi:acyl-CoA thioester hydrolase